MFDHIVNAIYRNGFKILMTIKPPFEPKYFEGRGSSKKLFEYLASSGCKKALIVTTEDLVRLNLLDSTYKALDDLGIEYVTFDKVMPNPTLSSVNEAITLYNQSGCDAVIAFGGGSVIDASKAISLQIGNNVPTEKLVGLFKAKRNAVPLYTVPTTAGTGSEVTSVAVISDDKTHKKLFIVDHKTISLATALDPDPMLGLPAFITADTGMDALTHAIEAYISRVNTPEAMELAVDAVKLVFENLPEAYTNGKNSKARENMALASYKAGIAFNRMGLGFVHAISHQLTALYGTAHGRANAIVLPYVLEESFEQIIPQLAALGKSSGVVTTGSRDREIATKFLDEIFKLGEFLKIPKTLDEIKEGDYQKIIHDARKEAIKNYPTPHLLSKEECKLVLDKIKYGSKDKY